MKSVMVEPLAKLPVNISNYTPPQTLVNRKKETSFFSSALLIVIAKRKSVNFCSPHFLWNCHSHKIDKCFVY